MALCYLDVMLVDNVFEMTQAQSLDKIKAFIYLLKRLLGMEEGELASFEKTFGKFMLFGMGAAMVFLLILLYVNGRLRRFHNIPAFAIERSGMADAIRQTIIETKVASRIGTMGIFPNCNTLLVAASI